MGREGEVRHPKRKPYRYRSLLRFVRMIAKAPAGWASELVEKARKLT
jgi:hypothetical protein